MVAIRWRDGSVGVAPTWGALLRDMKPDAFDDPPPESAEEMIVILEDRVRVFTSTPDFVLADKPEEAFRMLADLGLIRIIDDQEVIHTPKV